MQFTLTTTTFLVQPDEIVQALVAELPDNAFNGIAFLTCDPILDYQALVEKLEAYCPVPVVGCTTLAQPFSPPDTDITASLTVFARPGLTRAVVLSQPLDPTETPARMAQLYTDCVEQLGEKPKALLLFMPPNGDYLADQYLSELFAVVDDVPVFGGLASDELRSDRIAVFAGGHVYTDRLVLVGLGGDIRPLFSIGCTLGELAEYAPKITAVDGYTVKEVDGRPFIEYLRRLGLDTDDPDLLRDTPLTVKVHSPDSDPSLPLEIKVLAHINRDEGSATFNAKIPAGSTICFGVLSPEDMESSTRQSMESLLRQMGAHEEDGYQYGLVFAVSCVCRYYTLVGRENIEGQIIREMLPPGKSVTGYYGFNEICPVWRKNGALINRLHGLSIIMLAL